MAQHWLPAGFSPPARLVHKDFHLRQLTIHDLVKDYDAVMSSVARLKGLFHGSDWPEGLSLEQNLIDLGWHQKEFQRGASFAYTVLAPDASSCLGCVYLYPSVHPAHDVQLLMWVRSSHARLDKPLFRAVSAWLERDWPFKRVASPGRTIAWRDYLQEREGDG